MDIYLCFCLFACSYWHLKTALRGLTLQWALDETVPQLTKIRNVIHYLSTARVRLIVSNRFDDASVWTLILAYDK